MEIGYEAEANAELERAINRIEDPQNPNFQKDYIYASANNQYAHAAGLISVKQAEANKKKIEAALKAYEFYKVHYSPMTIVDGYTKAHEKAEFYQELDKYSAAMRKERVLADGQSGAGKVPVSPSRASKDERTIN